MPTDGAQVTPDIPPPPVNHGVPVATARPCTQPRRRGHAPKIDEARVALEREGQLPRNLRPVVRDGRILGWLQAHGYAGDLPSRDAIRRFFENEAR